MKRWWKPSPPNRKEDRSQKKDPPADAPKADATDASGNTTTRALWDRVTEVVDGALRRPDPADRAAYLRRAYANDPELRIEVESLLPFEQRDSGILGGPLLGHRLGARSLEDEGPRPAITLEPGQTVGPYRIEKVIGQGGMGSVALARDGDLDRRVALKVIRSDKYSPEARHRFARERRMLARMEHPAIAQIFETDYLPSHSGGEPLPYFTMEYVEGEPIDAYCDRHQLDLPARLELLIEICEGLDSAHRQLVVHRDLKPSNILVTAEGRPKLLDFGIAKELDQDPDADLASITKTGQQPMTLLGASPEQARGLPVGVATDIYSLGLVAYRLLCGHPAYVLDGDHFESIRRICEETPPTLSSRVGLIFDEWKDGEPQPVTPTRVAADRGTDVRTLRRLLRGDLDAIVTKMLAKEPEERYRSAKELALDLRRHLAGLPVEARAATTAYRLGKLLRRRWRRLLGVLSVAVLLGFGAFSQYDARRRAADQLRAAEQAKEQERQAVRQAEALTDFARNLVLSTDPDSSSNQAMTPRRILARGESEARRNLVGEPEMLAHQLEALGLAHYRLRDVREALRLFEESFRIRREQYGVGEHPLIARSLNNLAAAASRSGDRSRAERLYRLALAMKKRLGQGPVELATVEANLASLLAFRGELVEAEGLYRNVLRVRRLDPDEDPGELAAILRSLGNLLYLDSRFHQAEPLLKEALDLRREHDGADSIHTAAVWSLLGRVFHGRGRLDAAGDALEQALSIRQARLGDDHLHVALSKKDSATLLFDRARRSPAEARRAEQLWAEAMAVLRTRKPAGAWELADAESQEGERLASSGQIEEALPLLRRSYRVLRQVRGERSIYSRRAWARLQEYE